MKICRICPSFPDKEEGTGVEIHLYNLTMEQKKLGLDIIIVAAGDKEEMETVNGVKVYRVKRRPFFQFTSGPELLRTAEKLAVSENFDVLQIHNPLVLPFFPKGISEIPMVFSVHATLMDYKNLFSLRTLHRSIKGYLEFYVIAKKLCEKATRITTGSSDEKNELSKFLGADPEKIVPVLGKVNTEFFRPGVRSNLKEKLKIDGPVVLSVGRLVAKKGYTYLIKAFRKVVNEIPNVNLIVVGCGERDEEYNLIKRMVSNLKLENNVKFFPRIPKKELLYYYSMCDLYVQPSISEGFPQTVEDAMACGKPVIATAAYGPKDVIKNNYNGFLVPRRDSEVLSRRIIELLQDEKKIKSFGKANRKIAVEQLDWKITARKHYEIYKAAIG